MLLSDMFVRLPTVVLLTPAVAIFRGSMAVSCCLLSFKVARTSRDAGSVARFQRVTLLDARSLYEMGAFGLTFVSFSNVLAARLMYKLVSLFFFLGRGSLCDE